MSPMQLRKLQGSRCARVLIGSMEETTSVMPTNLYGPGDNYHQDDGHVVPALIRQFHEAKINELDEVIVWGSGAPRREFLYVDDMAEASLFVHNLDQHVFSSVTQPMLSHVNVGTGVDVTIKELATTIKSVVGFEGGISFDETKPDGTPRKLLNVDLLETLGWHAKVQLQDGLTKSYVDFIQRGLGST